MEPRLRRSKEPHDVAVRDAAAFRFSGGAARVEHVAELLRRAFVCGRSGGKRDVLHEDEPRSVVAGQSVCEVTLREQHGRFRISEHEGEALCGIREIDGEIRRTSLHDAEQRDDERRATLHAESHDFACADAHIRKVRGHGVCAVVELAIGQTLVVLDQSDGIRLAGSALGEEGVKRTFIARVALRRSVLRSEEAVALGTRNQRDVPHGAALWERAQDVGEVPEHPLDGRRIES